MTSKIRRYVIAILTAVIVFSVFVPCLTASADGNASVISVDFYVELLPDGNAKITEKWELSYDGSFHRFRHGYYTDLPKVQQFDSIVAKEFRIDNQTVPMDNSQRDMSGYVLTESKELQLCWYKYIDGTSTNTYEATYLLKNVVKRVENSPVFSCRFVGANFKMDIGEIRVHFKKLPGIDVTEANTNNGAAVMDDDGTYLNITKSFSSGLYGVTFMMNEDSSSPYFTAVLTEVNSNDVKRAMKKTSGSGSAGQTASKVFSTVIAFIFNPVVFFFFFIVMAIRKSTRKDGGFHSSGGGGSFGGCGGCGGGGCGGGGCGGGGCGGGGAD